MAKRAAIRIDALETSHLGTVGDAALRIYRRLVAQSLRLPHPQAGTRLHDVGVERNLRVPMPDGVALMADHYYPRAAGSFPTILMRTPYGRGFEVPPPMGLISIFFARRYAERGYHVIVQTVRGRYDSGGQFRP